MHPVHPLGTRGAGRGMEPLTPGSRPIHCPPHAVCSRGRSPQNRTVPAQVQGHTGGSAQSNVKIVKTWNMIEVDLKWINVDPDANACNSTDVRTHTHTHTHAVQTRVHARHSTTHRHKINHSRKFNYSETLLRFKHAKGMAIDHHHIRHEASQNVVLGPWVTLR